MILHSIVGYRSCRWLIVEEFKERPCWKEDEIRVATGGGNK